MPAKGTASSTLKITAAAGLAPGFYQVALAAKAANGAVIPTVRILVTVASPGKTIPTAYVSNYSDNTVSAVDTSTHRPVRPSRSAVARTAWWSPRTTPRLFVANNNTNNVTVIDTTTNTVTATVPVGSVQLPSTRPRTGRPCG